MKIFFVVVGEVLTPLLQLICIETEITGRYRIFSFKWSVLLLPYNAMGSTAGNCKFSFRVQHIVSPACISDLGVSAPDCWHKHYLLGKSKSFLSHSCIAVAYILHKGLKVESFSPLPKITTFSFWITTKMAASQPNSHSKQNMITWNTAKFFD